ncbi:MAG: serine/threonine-protein kinase, partial [Luteimonas sp.]
MSDQGAVRHWAEVDRLLDRVLALPPTDRAAFVEQQTTEDPRLREEVLALLADLRTRGDLLDRPAVDALSRRAPAQDLAPGHRIGAYQVSSLLGRGGMGEVYRAERADGQFEHHVALKLLRQDAVEHLGLFVSERRILATLEHPGIARLYDAGVSDDGRPYMVMELVDGMPITDWCAQRQASLHERLALFMQVCEAVAYAHQNLVIHRDLKPGNILVTANGRAKLLDFGVAKLLSGSVEEATRNTPLTLSYAAPEQLKQAAVSTATDLYALGVLLFELLT